MKLKKAVSLVLMTALLLITVTSMSSCGRVYDLVDYEIKTFISRYLLRGEVVIPEGTTRINDFEYANCNNITSIIIPDSVTYIGTCAFIGCDSLTSITIPDSVTGIADLAFCDCVSLVSINYTGTKAQWEAILKDDAWDNGTGEYTITCTDGTLTK